MSATPRPIKKLAVPQPSLEETLVSADNDELTALVRSRLAEITGNTASNSRDPLPTYRLDFSKLGNIPQALKGQPNWVAWKLEKRNGKETKVPYAVQRGLAKSNDSSTWTTFEEALNAADVLNGKDYDGIGFMLQGTNLVGIDFDGVVEDSKPEPFVLAILELLCNPYSEITPSGKGLRCFVECAALPEGQRKFSAGHYGAEIYIGNEGGRYLTVTGDRFSGEGIPKIDDIRLAYFLISRLRDERFKKLWMGDLSAYDNDKSRADLALLGILCRNFKDADDATIDQFFRASKLVREKWTEREDYRQRTIKKARQGDTKPDPQDYDTAYGVQASEAPSQEHPDPVAAEIHTTQVPDMSESVLVGRLGEIYDKYMRKDFPIGYAWLSLVTLAGTLVAPMSKQIRTNLYSCLVGEPGVGKTQCNDWARALIGITPPILEKVFAGSSEGLVNRLRASEGGSRLLSVDELSHLLAKSKIDNASFPYVLNQAYYDSHFTVVAARGREMDFSCSLSILGCVVEENFEKSFGAESVGGLYDRFGFAQCPTGYHFDYRPCPYDKVFTELPEPVQVTVDPEVWEAKRTYTKDLNLNSRVFEIGLRVAAVCAAVDGRPVVKAADLLRVVPFVIYQTDVRRMLQPNPGENVDGILANKFLHYIEHHGARGEWLDVRTMIRSTHAYEYGVGHQRVLDGLERSGEIEQHGRGIRGQKHLIRRAA